MNWYKRQLKIAKLSSDQISKIEQMVLKGKSFGEIANIFNVTRQSIHYLNNKYKWRDMSLPSFSPEQIEQIRQLVLDKKPFREIGKMFGVSKTTIQNLNNKYKWRDIKKEKEERDRLIADLYLLPPDGQGMSAIEITRQYGFNYKTIREALKRLNLIDNWRDISDDYIKRFDLNPNMHREQGESLRRRYEEDPNLRARMSELNKQHYIDNPELKDTISEGMKEYWRNYPGGYYAWLSTFPPEKQKEIERARSANSVRGRQSV